MAGRPGRSPLLRRGDGGEAPSAREYALADAFILGSFYEAFGLVVAEAMAAGLPVVVTVVGGLSHVLAIARSLRVD